MTQDQKIEIGLGVAGVAIAAFALLSNRSSPDTTNSQETPSPGAPISSSALTSQTNTYNNDAASVAEGITSAQAQVAEAALTAGSSAISAYTNASQNDFAQLANNVNVAQTTSAQEYETQLNALTSSYASHEQAASNAYSNFIQGSVQEQANNVNASVAQNVAAIQTTGAEYQTNLNDQLARDQSNNKVTQQKIADTPSFGTVFGQVASGLSSLASGFNLSSLFGGGGGQAAGSVSTQQAPVQSTVSNAVASNPISTAPFIVNQATATYT